METPKWKNCKECGIKPKLIGRQYGYSEKDTDYRLECSKCKRQSDWKDFEVPAVLNWNHIN